MNIVVGPNASGKTNLIEALLVAARGDSYRVSDKDLVAHGTLWARVDALSNDSSRTVKIQLDGMTVHKEFIIDATTRKRLSHPHTLPVVLFEPNQLLLFTQSPELRRGYLDEVIAQTAPGYAQLLRGYRRALAQRNRLLKQPNTPADMYFVWNVRLSELGGQIAGRRAGFIAAHADTINELYNNLVDASHDIRTEYKTNLPVETYGETMVRELEKRLTTDKERGFTTIGPHRDDMRIVIDGHDLAFAASRGETRTIVLALKLLELSVLEKSRDQKPILLLDDVFSELDGSRRRSLTKHLRNHQSFITTTDADIVAHHFASECTIIAMG